MNGEETLTATLTVVNERGLHARAAAAFVQEADRFKNATIQVRRADKTVPATSILGLLTLGAGYGATLDIIARGTQARAALDALSDLVRQGFREGPAGPKI